jgi:hypothetical protein
VSAPAGAERIRWNSGGSTWLVALTVHSGRGFVYYTLVHHIALAHVTCIAVEVVLRARAEEVGQMASPPSRCCHGMLKSLTGRKLDVQAMKA